jgi:hypothetical protein
MSQESVSVNTCPEQQAQCKTQTHIVAQHNHQPGDGQLQRRRQTDQFQFQHPRPSPAKGHDGSQASQQWPADSQDQCLIWKQVFHHHHRTYQGHKRAY